MKSTVADYQTIVYCVRVVAPDGTAVRFASYPHDLVMTNVSPNATYQADYGYEFTGFDATNSGSASVVDLEAILATAGIDRIEIASGFWDNARLYLFATSWANPQEDEEPISLFLFGKAKLKDDRYVTELMSLADALNQDTGRNVSPTCPWVLADQNLDGDMLPYEISRCSGPRNVSPKDGVILSDVTVNTTITGVTSNKIFTVGNLVTSPLTYANDYFGAGDILFLTGENSVLRSVKIRSYTAAGVITLFEPMPYDVAVGNSVTLKAGCRKRFTADCVGKFSNGKNSGSAPDLPDKAKFEEFGSNA